MAFDKRGLITEKIETREACPSHLHFMDLLVWGACMDCKRLWSLPSAEEKVWPRVDELKRADV